MHDDDAAKTLLRPNFFASNQQETTQAADARCVCVHPASAVSMPLSIRPVRVGCLQKSSVAKEFSQHRHRASRSRPQVTT